MSGLEIYSNRINCLTTASSKQVENHQLNNVHQTLSRRAIRERIRDKTIYQKCHGNNCNSDNNIYTQAGKQYRLNQLYVKVIEWYMIMKKKNYQIVNEDCKALKKQ